MQNVDHADVLSCLHYLFIREFEEGEGKRKRKRKKLEVGFVCGWLVWLYVEKWIDDDDDDVAVDDDVDDTGRQSPFFSFRSFGTCTCT